MLYFYIGIIFLFLGGLFAIQVPEKFKAKILSIFSGLGTVFVLIPALDVLFTGQTISKTIYLLEPINKVTFLIDPLGAFFVLVISVMSFIGSIYAIGYIKPYLDKNNCVSSHFFFLSVLIASMLMVVTVQNVIFFLIVWEIMSLSSFFLVIFENDKKEVISAGINYLVTMHISILFIMIGFIMLIQKSNNLNFAAFKPDDLIFVLLFIGFGIKAGFVPFHTWLPKAHPAAPSHVSGIMSGVMIKTGIYGILRILSLMEIPSLGIAYFVLIISIITALFGILYAISQSNFKKILAYSSIENIGVIGIGIGIGMLGLAYHNNLVAFLGFSGGILHILNHSIFKELLFFAAGAVYNKTHTKNIEKLGGLIKSMPYTAGLFLIGAVAITGLPPLNGFVSEFVLYFGMLNSLQINAAAMLIISVLSIASLALIGTMALLCFTKAFSITFLGKQRSKESESVKDDVSKIMLFPMGILSVFIFLIGLFPQWALMIVKYPASILIHTNIDYQITPILAMIGKAGFGVVILFAFVYGLRTLLLKKNTVCRYKTWDCGYQYGSSRIQYTASSYVSPFLSFLKPFLVKKFDILKPVGLFPKEAHFKLKIYDVFEYYLIKPVINANRRFLEKFYWIQSGSTQQYILYGLIFLVIALVGTIGVK